MTSFLVQVDFRVFCSPFFSTMEVFQRRNLKVFQSSTPLFLLAIIMIATKTSSRIQIVGAFRCIRSVQQQQQHNFGGPRSLVRPRQFASVTGIVYDANDGDDKGGSASAPTVTLFTKEGCTLCDKVKDVLVSIRDDHPHTLVQEDITDNDSQNEVFGKYKYDIPVLHLDGKYWIKHRLTVEEAVKGLTDAREGRFEPAGEEPNAAEYER